MKKDRVGLAPMVAILAIFGGFLHAPLLSLGLIAWAATPKIASWLSRPRLLTVQGSR